ncbi:SigE family RNA polymerase sigma factor [Nocardioides bigeumensis]|uniref:SigE family RNA polymerase sigma factor n=1 Tax=Nocardioides bigeumensis TaxID=433657 RepID=A0ABP5JIE2_9ACTN
MEQVGFVEFVAARSRSLMRTAYLLTGDHQRSEDPVQATLTKVYLKWARVSRMDQPAAYARRILVNEATRSRWWRASGELTGRLPETPADDASERLATSSSVWNAVLRLPPRQRAVVVLRYYEDLSEAEIADVLGIAPGTVKSTAHAATQRLAGALADLMTEGSTP